MIVADNFEELVKLIEFSLPLKGRCEIYIDSYEGCYKQLNQLRDYHIANGWLSEVIEFAASNVYMIHAWNWDAYCDYGDE